MENQDAPKGEEGDGQAAQPARPRQRYFSRGHLIHCMKVLGVAGIAVTGLLAAYVKIVVVPTAPDVANLQQAKNWRPSVVLAADGSELTSFRQRQQKWVALDRISPHVIQALLATEDHRFYEHPGFDVGRTVSALLHTANGDMQGGSTITQQLARNLFPEEIGRSRNALRKLKEIVTAVKIEHAYTKGQILETYLNTVPFLYNVYGIEMAAQTYFGKTASQLGPAEAATLIGMLKGTHYYNPVVNPERALARRNVVLAQMMKYGFMPAEQYRALRGKPLSVHFNRQAEQNGPSTHFIEYVRRWATQWAEENDYDLSTDGLVLKTTLEPALQEVAEQAVEKQTQALQDIADVEWSRRSPSLLSSATPTYARLRKHADPFSYFWKSRPELLDAFVRESPQFKRKIQGGASEAKALAALKQDEKFMDRLRAAKTRLEAGFLAMDPNTGEVKAWVGSRDFERDQFDHVAQAMRQPGSTFKPFVYGAALERGFDPDSTYRDGPVEIRFADGEVWKPTDMSPPSGRLMTMREGLIFSRNAITAQVMQDVGLIDVLNLARASGITQSRLDPVPSLALGTSPVTLLEMVSAYSTIARLGEYRKPVVVRTITDRNGKVLAEFGKSSKRAMSENTAVELIDMMRGVVSHGTGTLVKAQFGISADVAGKTGTTQNNTDGWFILMHPDLVAGSWVGFNDARVTMRSNYWGQGGHNALLLVGDFFRSAIKEKMIDAKAKFPRPKRHHPPIRNPNSVDDFETPLDAEAPHSEIVVRREPDGHIFIGDEQGARAAAEQHAFIAQDELDRIISAMGRDPASGVRIDASGSSGPQAAGQAAPPEEAVPAHPGGMSNTERQSFR